MEKRVKLLGLKKRVKFHALRLPFFLRKISPQTGEWREKERGGIKSVTNSSIEGKITLFGHDIYKMQSEGDGRTMLQRTEPVVGVIKLIKNIGGTFPMLIENFHETKIGKT